MPKDPTSLPGVVESRKSEQRSLRCRMPRSAPSPPDCRQPLRLDKEDGCQATRVDPADKYQTDDNGPTSGKIADALSAIGGCLPPLPSIAVFTVAIGNAEAIRAALDVVDPVIPHLCALIANRLDQLVPNR